MAFDFDETNPADTALISSYPTNERASRAAIQGSFTNDHNEAEGDHVKVGLEQGALGGGDEPALDGTLGFLYAEDIGGETELHYKSDAGQVVIITTNGVIAPLAVLKAGDTMTGDLIMSGADIKLGNNVEMLLGETTVGGVFLELAFVDSANVVRIGAEGAAHWLRANAANGFIAIYPGGPDTEHFYHQGNDGVGSGLDADTVDTHEAAAIFSASMTTGDTFFFQSAIQSAATNSGASLAHSLAQQPSLVMGVMKANTADLGYSVGDEIVIGVGGSPVGDTGIIIGADATNVFYAVGNNILRIVEKNAPRDELPITHASWDIVIRAWT